MQYTLSDASAQLKKLMEQARSGETIVITDEDGLHAVQLIPVAEPKRPRKAGTARGQINLRDDFDAPLDEFAEYQ
jgi:prevent-host-death family protein